MMSAVLSNHYQGIIYMLSGGTVGRFCEMSRARMKVESSLDDEYSVTRVATEVAWYSPFVMWSRGGASGRNDGRRLE